MSCTSPLTVPITNVPTDWAPVSASSGRSTSIEPAIARPAMSISGTKKSPRSNRAPTSSSDGMRASKSIVSGPMPRARPWLVSARTAGALPTRVSSYRPCRISSGVMLRPPSGYVATSSAEICSARSASSWPTWSSCRDIRALGPVHPDRGDHAAVATAYGRGDRAEPDLELLSRSWRSRGGGSVARSVDQLGRDCRCERAVSRGSSWSGPSPSRQLEAVVGVEDLAGGACSAAAPGPPRQSRAPSTYDASTWAIWTVLSRPLGMVK